MSKIWKESEKNNRLYDLCDSIKQYSVYVFQIQIEKTERDRNTAEKVNANNSQNLVKSINL